MTTAIATAVKTTAEPAPAAPAAPDRRDAA